MARACVSAFLATDFLGGRHQRRVDQLAHLFATETALMATAADVERDRPIACRTASSPASLSETDPAVEDAVGAELHREQTQIELIASENIVSRAVLEAQGSVLTNKYAEGYPGRRYYGLRIRRHGRDAGDRAGEEIVRLRFRQRPAAFGRAGQWRGVAGAA